MIDKKEVETMSNDGFKYPELILGRLLLEIIKEDSSAYKKEQYGVDKFEGLKGFEIVDGVMDEETGYVKAQKFNSVPYKKGKILKMASNAFGQKFKYYYGEDNITPEVGDIVMFIPNQSYRLDAANKYHIITDEHVIAYYKGETNE